MTVRAVSSTVGAFPRVVREAGSVVDTDQPAVDQVDRQPRPAGAPAPKPVEKADATLPQLQVMKSPFDPQHQEITFKALGKVHATPAIPKEAPVPRGEVLDVVIVGGGLAGLTAMHEIDGKNKVMMLEWLDKAGGLAAQSHRDGVTYANGAAYFTKPDADIRDFYEKVGLGNPKKVEIANPIDSYWLSKRKFVPDIWEKGVHKLPEDFKDFKEFLETVDYSGFIGEVPFEDAPEKIKMWDRISTAEMISEYGPEVKVLLDLYCRSALGTTSEYVSAMAFLNFYIDEIGPRYTFPGGTGGVSSKVEEQIRARGGDNITTGAYVYDLHNRPDGLVEVRYMKDGKAEAVLAKQAILTTPVSASARIVKDLPEDQKKLFQSVEHANYLVHNIFTPESVFDKSYDTWVKGLAFTDVIVGRWQEFKTKGKRIPKKNGILTIYQPLPKNQWPAKLTDAEIEAEARKCLKDLAKVAPGIKKQKQIDIESYRWPESIHIARPGLMTEHGALMRRQHGNIIFANNNLGVPSFEEAIHRGLVAAKRVNEYLKAQRQGGATVVSLSSAQADGADSAPAVAAIG